MMTRFALAALLTLMLASALMAADQKTCAACGKPISTGQYTQADGQYFHAEHFICAYCRKPIGTSRYFTQNGLRYDSTCFVNEISARCAYCRKPVGTNWVTYDGQEYHKECYDNFVALRCSFCGEIIDGEYLRDQWGNTYHEYHKNEPRCQYCGRLFTAATNGGERFSDGRSECGVCLENAVCKKLDAETIMYDVKATLASLGIGIDRDKLPVKLVDAGQLSTRHGNRRNDLELAGLTQFEKSSWLYGLVNSKKFTIYILHSLPRKHYVATIAHELMHVWLGLNAPMTQSSAMVEGTCNYAAYLILKQLADEESERMIDQMTGSTDPNYGEGFRRVKAQVELLTLPGWLEYLKKNERPPW